MYLRLMLSTIVLLAVAANQPGLAKDGHAQHSGRASATNNGASGKGASGASPPAAKASVPIDAEATVAPPVLPPHGVTQQQIRTINPSGKNQSSKTPANSVSRATTGATTVSPARNAIGQPVVPSRNFAGAQPPVPALQRSGAVSAPIIHGGPVAAPVASGAARVNGANAVNRVSINGATVIRPANAPAVVGGPAVARYGINGTTVQNKH
ncbi:MAG: hypothetical protein WAK67_23405 [Xanthobacteraceae bacterium]|jgi:hypothetical protein